MSSKIKHFETLRFEVFTKWELRNYGSTNSLYKNRESHDTHVASRPVSFPPHPIPGGMLSRSLGMPSRREGPPSIWDTHGLSGNVFAGPVASSSAPYPQEFNPGRSSTEEPLHSSTVEKSERQTQDQDQRCQSGPSARNSVIPSEGEFSNNYGQTNNDCRFLIFTLTSSLHQRRLLAGRQGSRPRFVLVHKFLRKLCIGSKKWRWLIQWMIQCLRHL